jgi:ATP-dependent DNA helicase RecG
MSFFDTSIEFLKGVGPQRATLLQKELKIFTYGDLLQHYPFRYEDRTRFYSIAEINETMPYVQIKGTISEFETLSAGNKKRLVGYFTDGKSEIELVWFQGVSWVMQKIKTNTNYVVFGKPNQYGSRFSIAHPEIEPLTEKSDKGGYLQPVYPVSEKLRARHIDSKFISRVQQEVLRMTQTHLQEILPNSILQKQKLLEKKKAIIQIHFPSNHELLAAAQHRLKFEELFFIQLRLIKMKLVRQGKFKGIVFNDTAILTKFYKEFLPFELTEAQKKVVREIYADMKSGKQMNRLLQGDVGSGKTIVAFICILLVVGSDSQTALIAPTEILAQQHYANLKRYAEPMGISIALLTGSVKKSARRPIHENLQNGSLKILIGKLWQKNASVYPHVLVMTATPIPRTLAMTLYGDLEISVIDQLPKGRKPIQTMHKYDTHRLQVNGFIKAQIEQGRQVYIVYSLIEESEKLDLKHLMDGYESISRAFPEVPISIVHGQMKAEAKDFEMKRFIKGETKIMVATTVIEVGVDVPNASVMIIESAQRFGLSQLHQLRGRVGRGADQSYCILMTDHKLGTESKTRIETMVRTNNGFEIAETDLKLRGPGDLMGTQQSGALDLLIADLSKDGELLKQAREEAQLLLENDPNLEKPENSMVLRQIQSIKKAAVNWSRIS